MSALERKPEVPASNQDEDLGFCTDLAVTPSINSKHDGNCDSLVSPQEQATVPYVNSIGSLTLFLQLERKADFHVSTRDEA